MRSRRIPVFLICGIGLALSACTNTLSLDKNPMTGSTASAYDTGGNDSAAPMNPLNPSEQVYNAGPRQVLKDPSVAEIMETGPLPEMSFGRADAPVTVIKYMSLTCPYCRKFQAEVYPELKKNYIDTGKVRFILREFPIGRSSGNATVALRCAPADKYMALYGKFLSQQGKWVSQEVRLDAIYEVAQQVGVSRAQFDSCLQDKKLVAGLKWVKDRGRTLGIIGTPNFFIDGKLVKKVLTYADLSAMIDAALAENSTQGVAATSAH
ncbi:MAG: thioredoxin domain-containing protein [Hyphomicrobiaceae bacterium]